MEGNKLSPEKQRKILKLTGMKYSQLSFEQVDIVSKADAYRLAVLNIYPDSVASGEAEGGYIAGGFEALKIIANEKEKECIQFAKHVLNISEEEATSKYYEFKCKRL